VIQGREPQRRGPDEISSPPATACARQQREGAVSSGRTRRCAASYAKVAGLAHGSNRLNKVAGHFLPSTRPRDRAQFRPQRSACGASRAPPAPASRREHGTSGRLRFHR